MLRHFAFLALACGCNPHNPQDACNDIVHAYCQRIFDVANQGCTQASDFMSNQGFSSLNDCMTGMSAVATMNGHTCAAMPTNGCAPDDFSGDRAASCTGDMGNLQCSYDWAQGPIPSAPECQNICCVHQGNPGSGMECCSGTSHMESTGCGLGETSICD
jgi:hypothetical protein